MGLLPCPFPCHTNKETNNSHSNSNSSLYSHFSTSSSSSLPSLTSVPSLTPSSLQDLVPSPTAVHLHCLATLKGHSSYIFSLALAGKFLLSGSSNSEIRAWNRECPSYYNHPKKPINANNKVATSTGAVKSLVVLGDKLFSAHQDHKIRVWKVYYVNNARSTETETGDAVRRETTQGYPKLTCIATLPTVNDRLLRFFSAKNYVQVRRQKKCTWVHHVDTVSALAISNDCTFLYSASWDRTFKVWTTSDFRCLESVTGAHDDAINAIVVSRDGVVYTGSADKKIKAWRKPPGEKKHSLVGVMEKHKSGINALTVSADGSTLYSGACDRSILVWRKESNNGKNSGGKMMVVGALRGHRRAVLCLVVVEDLVCSGSADNTVRIWRKGLDKSYSCLAVCEGHRRPVKCLVAATDRSSTRCDHSDATSNYLVYSGSLDCDVKVWHIKVPSIC